MEFNGVEAYDSITPEFCSNIKSLFGDYDHHDMLGGLNKLGQQVKDGNMYFILNRHSNLAYRA